MEDIEKLEDEFLSGNIGLLRNRPCPYCCSTGILFSMSKRLVDDSAIPGRRYKAGITIYCRGKCNSMIAHMDGYCPEWAEEISDWTTFSDDLVGSPE